MYETLILQASWIMVLITGPLAILSLIIGKLKGVKFTVPSPKDEKSPFALGESRPSIQTRVPVSEDLVTREIEQELGVEEDLKKPQKKEETGTMLDLFPEIEEEQKPQEEPKKQQKKQNNHDEENDKNQGGRPKTSTLELFKYFDLVPEGTPGSFKIKVPRITHEDGQIEVADNQFLNVAPKKSKTTQNEAETSKPEEEPLFPPETEEEGQQQ